MTQTFGAPRGCFPPAILAGIVFCAGVALLVLAIINGFGGTLLQGVGLPDRPAPASAETGIGTPAGAPAVIGADANGVPPVSQRYFSGGSVQASATGDFELTTDLPVDRLRGYVSNDGLAWIAFGDETGGGTSAPTVLITFNEPEDTVMVAQGSTFAKGVDDQCQFDVQVTDARISGRIVCPEATVYHVDGSEAGRSSIDVTFDAAS